MLIVLCCLVVKRVVYCEVWQAWFPQAQLGQVGAGHFIALEMPQRQWTGMHADD